MSGALYLGSLSAVNDHPLLKAHGITHLVQALEAPWAPPARKEGGFVAYSIDIRGKESVDLRPHLDAACVYIERALRRGRACWCIVSRCVSLSVQVFCARARVLVRVLGFYYSYLPWCVMTGRLALGQHLHRVPHPQPRHEL
jgi:hypothetical protein